MILFWAAASANCAPLTRTESGRRDLNPRPSLPSDLVRDRTDLADKRASWGNAAKFPRRNGRAEGGGDFLADLAVARRELEHELSVANADAQLERPQEAPRLVEREGGVALSDNNALGGDWALPARRSHEDEPLVVTAT
jgi:hypothetical protein